MNPITLNLSPVIKLTDEQYYELATATANRHLRIERNKNGELIIMPPTGGWTGNRNIKLTQRLANWTDIDGTGIAFDSSTEFNLPNGGDRSPDASWIRLDRWNTLTTEEQDKFPPICPDFVVELRSKTDRLRELQDKMQEYRDSGLRLGWLIDPQNRAVEIYRQGRDVETCRSPLKLSGEDVLPGFVLDLSGILS